MDQILKGAKFTLWFRDPPRFFKDIYNQEPYPYQSEVLKLLPKIIKDPNTLNRIRRLIVMAAGGTGKTKLLGCIALWLTVVLPKFIGRPYSVIIISGSQDQSRYLYEYSKYAVSDNEILREEVEGEPLQSIIHFKDRSVIMAVPNSLKAIQGKHVDCVIVDEGALAGDFIINDTLRIVSTSDLDLIILSGTPMVYSTKFVDIWESPERYPEWTRRTWSAKDCPNISIEKWNEAKNLPEDMFAIFWEGKPYASIGTMIPTLEIRTVSKDVPKFSPNPNYEIIGGLDWGWRHYTALVLLQKNKETEKIEVVYVDYWRREDFEDMHKKIGQICQEYKVTKLYTDAEDIGENQRLQAEGVRIEPIAFNQNKIQMQSHMKVIFHQDKIRIPEVYKLLIDELRKYNWTTKQDDDLVDALQLGLWACKDEIEKMYFEII